MTYHLITRGPESSYSCFGCRSQVPGGMGRLREAENKDLSCTPKAVQHLRLGRALNDTQGLGDLPLDS